jgi:hypothetical protein
MQYAPVIFEQSERPAWHVKRFPLTREVVMAVRFFASLKNDGDSLKLDER